MKNKSFLSSVFNLSFDDDYEDYLEYEDEKIRKSISDKIVKEDRLTNEEYIRLLEIVLSESKKQFKLNRNGKSYEMVFRETPMKQKEEDRER